jgi:F-type H+-transporting ATPase subunit gamma
MLEAFVDKNVDSIEVIYSRFVNTLVQEPARIPLLPLEDLDSVIPTELTNGLSHTADNREIHYEPGPKAILDKLLNLHIKQQIYQMVLEAKASEHSARMVAMKSATDNANTLVDDLTLDYNKARQAAITQEILEIAAASFSNN